MCKNLCYLPIHGQYLYYLPTKIEKPEMWKKFPLMSTISTEHLHAVSNDYQRQFQKDG
jgi:hypothetical protein